MISIVRFPGSNCDRDCEWAVTNALQANATFAWHDDDALPDGTTGVILPGGFSYGDYLRVAAIAAQSPIVKDVVRFAEQGGPVLGICNGFQVLTECGLLEGALMRNHHGRFVCDDVDLEVCTNSPWSGGVQPGEKITLPVAHGDGNYVADDEVLDKLEAEHRILFRYGRDINGSKRNVAGIIGGPRGNVCGLMPHPERRAEARLGGDVGLSVLRGLLN